MASQVAGRGVRGWFRVNARLPIVLVLAALLTLLCWRLLMAPGLSAFDPETGRVIAASGLFSPAVLAGLLVDAPRIVTAFPPLGIFVLLVLGASVAERAGLFNALFKAGFSKLPYKLLTPVTVIIGLLAHQLGDALLAVYLPLAGAAYAARGRSPVLGILVAFAAFAGAFAGTITPGVPEVVLFQFTQSAANNTGGVWPVDLLGNWYIGLATAILYTGATWVISDRWLEPRWFSQSGAAEQDSSDAVALNRRLLPRERVALGYALLAAVLTCGACLFLIHAGFPAPESGSGSPILLSPFARAFPAVLALILLSAGWAFGAGTGALSAPGTVRASMIDGLAGLAPFILAAVVVAFILAAITLSHLDRVLMLMGAQVLQQVDAAPPVTLVSLVFVTALADLLVGSATAKWAVLAPIVVPMLMSTGISPSMATAAYRIGDSALNIVSPLNPYVALVLLYCRRWRQNLRLVDMLRALSPFAAAYLLIGAGIILIWSIAEWPPGPTTTFSYDHRR